MAAECKGRCRGPLVRDCRRQERCRTDDAEAQVEILLARLGLIDLARRGRHVGQRQVRAIAAMFATNLDADRCGRTLAVRSAAKVFSLAMALATAGGTLGLQAISGIGVQAQDHPSGQRGDALGGDKDRDKSCSEQSISPEKTYGLHAIMRQPVGKSTATATSHGSKSHLSRPLRPAAKHA